MLTSQALVLATAMAASAGTLIIFNLLQERYTPIPRKQDSRIHGKEALKSCLSSGGKRRNGKRRIKKVRFADDVKDSRRDLNEKFERKAGEKIESSCCGKEMLGLRRMPANRVALYSGILRNRVQMMEYSY
ncbi:hypothetical protein F511_06073 [Dorcoceras hygrometricum]|uniref:Uncharacterized protein n=1 Tax=Dorcoceras hygrometricum TaxID=472368 RepID=A0A2Z7DAD0_9LAMI|nr:hypothetical protein F511_06073 [Dorcoceras hygrometricum]